jgi:fumarate hydratase class I
MDPYVAALHRHGASLVMVGKGHRTRECVDACRANGGFYLGAIGGAAALAAENHIRKAEVIGFEEFGMEAAWRIEVEDFPAFVVIDDKGNDFYEQLARTRVIRMP